jgi:hypothetical protein
MKKNMNTADRIFRFAAALILGILYFTNVVTGVLGIIVIVFAVLLFVFSVTGNCPLYIPFGKNNYKPKESKV